MPIYRVNINQLWLGQQVMNVFYYETTALLDGDQMEEAATDIRGGFVSFDTSRMSDEWSYTGLTFRQVDVPGLPEITVPPDLGPYTGSVVGSSMPTQVALLVTGQANTAFPRRVRTYLAGLVEGTFVDGEWSAGVVTAALSLIGSDFDSIIVVGDQLDRVSVELGDLGSGQQVVDSNRVTSYNVTRIPATQRRRRIGVGE